MISLGHSDQSLGYNLRETYPGIDWLLGAHFYQGFHKEYEEEEEAGAIRYVLDANPDHIVEGVVRDLERFFERNPPEEEVRAVFEATGVYFLPLEAGYESYRQFLEQLYDWLVNGVPDDVELPGDRAPVERPVPRASSFPDVETAEWAVGSAIVEHGDRIEAWMASGWHQIAIDADLGQETGLLIERVKMPEDDGPTIPVKGDLEDDAVARHPTAARAILRKDPSSEPTGYRVHTSFPVDRETDPDLRVRYPFLAHFLPAYWHQDWCDDYFDLTEVLIQKAVVENDREVMVHARDELARFLEDTADMSEDDLCETLWFGFGMEYDARPEDITYRAYLRHVLELVDEELAGA